MSEPLKEPLWDMMISTNDCYPGCGCEDDRFQITEERIGEWVSKNELVTSQQALSLLQKIENFSPKELEELSMQTNLFFEKKSECLLWVKEWQGCLKKCIG